MKIKRYFAPDVRQAMRMVRDTQGPEAVILSNKRVDGGVEIVAAIDYDDSIFPRATTTADKGQQRSASSQGGQQSSSHAQLKEDSLSSSLSAASRYEQSAGTDQQSTHAVSGRGQQGVVPSIQWGQEPAIVEMQTELKNLRGMLERQLSGLAWDDYARRHPNKAEVIQKLSALGVSEMLCRNITDLLPEQGNLDGLFRAALNRFSTMIPLANDEILNEGGVVAMVGPTGVGKTTTAAKLAARYALRHGSRHVALVTIDNYRVCAHEQLRTYGKILDIPVKTADTRMELRKVLDDLCDRRLVLIDTAGMSQRDSHLAEQASILCGDDMYIKTSLVVSATSQVASISDVIRAFGVFDPVSLILTKLDEATSIGGALDMAVQHGMPVSYVCDGQQVPEDLHLARATDLVSRCVDIMERRVPNKDGAIDLIMQPTVRGAANANV